MKCMKNLFRPLLLDAWKWFEDETLEHVWAIAFFRKDLRGTSYPEDKDVVTARSVRVIYNFLR